MIVASRLCIDGIWESGVTIATLTDRSHPTSTHLTRSDPSVLL